MADKKSLVNIDFGGSSSIKNIPSATAASGDYIVLTDESDGGKAKKGPSFGTNDGTFLRKDGTWAGLGGMTISANATPIVTFKKSATSSGSFIGFKPNNQDNSVWLAGVTSALAFRFSYSTNGGTTTTKKMEIDADGNLDVAGYIKDGGTKLSDLYGAKKYRHNIVVEWNTGSGTSHYAGSLSFSFIDGSSQDYSTTGATYGIQSFHLFLKDHCGMTDDKLTAMPMSGYAIIGSVALPTTYYVTSIYNDHGSWYTTGGYQASNSNNRGVSNGGYDDFIPSTVSIVMHDHVEEC